MPIEKCPTEKLFSTEFSLGLTLIEKIKVFLSGSKKIFEMKKNN